MLGIRTWPLPAVAAYPRLTLNSCRRWWTVWCGLACIPAIMARPTNRWQTSPLRRITKLSMSIRSLQNGGTLLLRVRTTSRSRRMLARPSILRQCVANNIHDVTAEEFAQEENPQFDHAEYRRIVLPAIRLWHKRQRRTRSQLCGLQEALHHICWKKAE